MQIAERPKFCPECGVKVESGGGFCGGCGKALTLGHKTGPADATTPAISVRATSYAHRAAFLLGGAWTVVNRLKRPDRAVWIARVAVLPWLGTLGGFLVWWGAYFFGDRATLDVQELVNLAAWLMILGVISCLLSLPLAKRSFSLLQHPGEVRQRRQATVGMVAHLAIIAAVVSSLVNATSLRDGIQVARTANDPTNIATSHPSVRDPYAELLKTSKEIAKEKKHEIPWNGKGLDPNFPTR